MGKRHIYWFFFLFISPAADDAEQDRLMTATFLDENISPQI